MDIYEYFSISEQDFLNLDEDVREEMEEEFQDYQDTADEFLEAVAIGNGDFSIDENGDIIIDD